ncbi:hypothetical protein [Streptomyces sirii]|uniref:hypothetical protein n=1 Tax=Streptomyces sirii TaxID=3127701 RepID=UPI003D36CCC4
MPHSGAVQSGVSPSGAGRSRTSVRTLGALLAGVMVCGGTAACTASGGKSAARSGGSGTINATPVAAVQKAVNKGARLNSGSYRLSGRVPGQGTVEGKVSFSLRPRAMDMRMKASGGREEGEFSVRLVGGSLYLGGGKDAAAAMGGKRWIKFPMKHKDTGPAGGFGGCDGRPTRTRRRRRRCSPSPTTSRRSARRPSTGYGPRTTPARSLWRIC